jgi:hypothetical protein
MCFKKILILLFLSLTSCGYLSSCTGAGDKPEDSSTVENNDNIDWEECGQRVGEHPCNFSLKDKDGNTFSLYDYYGDVIVLDFSTMWCGYCGVAAQTVQEHQDKHGPAGFQYVTVLIEDYQGSSVSEAEAKIWADTYGITSAPVLVGDRSLIDPTAVSGYPITGWPTFVIINRDMVITSGISGWSEQALALAIESSL